MKTPAFLESALAGKDGRTQNAAIRVLDLYLSAPLWNREDSSSDRRAKLRQILEQAVTKPPAKSSP
jgi:hypothetical protein